MTIVVCIDFYQTKYTRVQVVHFIPMFPFSLMGPFPFCTFPILFSCEKCFVHVFFFTSAFLIHSLSLTCSKGQYSSPQILHIKHDLMKQPYTKHFTSLKLNLSHSVQFLSAQNSTFVVVFPACKIFIYQFLLYKETPFYFFPDER